MNPALPNIIDAWKMRFRPPFNRSRCATTQNTRISNAYIIAVSRMMPQLANNSARSVPATALENTNTGISTFNSSEHMPFNAVMPYNRSRTQI